MELFGPVSGGLIAVLLFGCFVQVITILSLIRYGLGLSGFDIGVVSFLLALVLSFFMIETKFGINGSLENAVNGRPVQFGDIIETKVRSFLAENSDPQIASRLQLVAASIAGSQAGAATTQDAPSLSQLEAAFILSQLKRALTVGLILLVPLLLIDLMVAITLTTVGIDSLPAMTLAIPLKLLLFVSIDGWNLIVDKLLTGFV